MGKYENSRIVQAVYTKDTSLSQTENPFLEAMPEILSRDEFFDAVKSLPSMPYDLCDMSPARRRVQIAMLSLVFYPMDYMHVIYDTLYRAILSSYTTKTVIDSIRQINALRIDFRNGDEAHEVFATTPQSGSILGVAGIGKTSAIRHCLSLIPQVIIHSQYNDRPFYQKQITHLIVECPSDCSVKTLAFHIAAAIDDAIGSDYFDKISKQRSSSASAIATQIKIICHNHHVGAIIIDEIQNAVATAQKTKQVKPLIRFLVELTNESCASIFFVGTPDAETMFVSQEHLLRRTRGLRLLPLKYGEIYREFLRVLWGYQFTLNKTELTDKVANRIFDYSGGIPAYIVRILQEAQVQAILTGSETLDSEMIKLAVERLGISVPRTYASGTYISDFTAASDIPPAGSVFEATAASSSSRETVPRVYANPRGRRKTSRAPNDLIELQKKYGTEDAILSALKQFDLLEER